MSHLPPKITIVRGDITKITADIIVNAANTSLLGGGGVDGAIHKAGGSKILEECRAIRAKQGGCKVGEAVITNAGNLLASYVLHTVGPKWNNGNSNEMCLLANSYKNTLTLAEGVGATTIAFPNISTGIYGFPKKLACAIAMANMRNFYTDVIKEVIFVCFDEENYQFYTEAIGNPNFGDFVKNDLLSQINAVFTDAPFPKITIQQAELLDDYISSGKKWDDAAKQDAQYRHWSEVPDAVFKHCTSALSFMDSDGFLFYYPAYMRLAVKYPMQDIKNEAYSSAIDSAIFHAGYTPKSKFQGFSLPQKRCIRHFLQYLAVFLGDIEATKALEKYWNAI
jgi:O-acetyl-ADP-ribose deacetylase